MSRIGGKPPFRRYRLTYRGGFTMKLEGDRIVIESRYEIDDIIDMIDTYQKHKEPKWLNREELELLKKQLDALYMCW